MALDPTGNNCPPEEKEQHTTSCPLCGGIAGVLHLWSTRHWAYVAVSALDEEAYEDEELEWCRLADREEHKEGDTFVLEACPKCNGAGEVAYEEQ